MIPIFLMRIRCSRLMGISGVREVLGGAGAGLSCLGAVLSWIYSGGPGQLCVCAIVGKYAV